MRIDLLFQGFPGRSSRGFLGWSSCALIRIEGKAPILFDTVGFNERYVLLSKLKDLGVNKDDIGTVILSHFHFDHAVNYSLFPNANFYLHEKEVKHIEENGGRDLAIPTEMYPALLNSGRLSTLSGHSGLVEGIQWVHTPGHTPGSVSLFLDYEGERWVLASDTIKNITELITGEAGMTWDPECSKQSIREIGEWADIVVPGHDRKLEIRRQNRETFIHPVDESVVNVSIPWRNNPYRLIVSEKE
jgi:glyoxylase-like metal-dependent hydrolase (beta-lactamase superfamily II)